MVDARLLLGPEDAEASPPRASGVPYPRIGGNSAVTLQILVGLVEQVSVDVGALPYIPTDRTQSLHA
jgi:hypothetical protein